MYCYSKRLMSDPECDRLYFVQPVRNEPFLEAESITKELLPTVLTHIIPPK